MSSDLATQPVKVTPPVLEEAFADLVLNPQLLKELGPALIRQKSLFIYGPTGNGKSSIAERLHRIYKDTVYIPYSVAVDGQIILVYDPVVHQAVEGEGRECDPRFVPCQRPHITTGGELTPSMLELRLDAVSQVYAAPIQMNPIVRLDLRDR